MTDVYPFRQHNSKSSKKNSVITITEVNINTPDFAGFRLKVITAINLFVQKIPNL